MFKRGYTMTLNRVHDVITIKEGEESIKLTVNGDAMHMVAGMNKASAKLKAIEDNTPDEEVMETAKYFAAVIFGKDQAEKLIEFYSGDPGCVISVCSQYFQNRLAGKITKVQKKLK